MVKFFSFIVLLFILSSSCFALFDTGTALKQGKFEADVAINPFQSISYGQNFVFLHYGLGNDYELHGYLSKHGSIFRWTSALDEVYAGILKQWADFEYLDLATSIGIRKVFSSATPSLLGPGVLYTLKISKKFRIAGHLQYAGEILSSGIRKLALGYTSEIGGYLKLTENVEFAAGAFTNSEGEARPIYTVNFYF